MKFLFWVNNFPLVSETFIRDQIVCLIDKGNQINIYTNETKKGQKLALNNVASYNLLDKVVNKFDLMPQNKLFRAIEAVFILLKSIFTPNFKYYINSLSVKKYGNLSKSLLLFYQVHYVIKNEIKIIHAHFGPNGSKAIILKKIGLPVKVFTTFHGYDIRLGLDKGGEIYSELFKFSDGIFSISNYNTVNLLKLGAQNHTIFKLKNGIDIDFYKRIKPIAISGKLKLLTVARLVDEKAIHIAIQALSELLENKPNLDFEYIIVGEGNKREELQNLINDYNISDKIKLVGFKNSNEVRDLMIASDLFLLPSKSEALPTVLLEAQSAELIVLATNVGSVKQMVKSGLVVEPLDVPAFKNGLLKILEKRNHWSTMASLGRAYVKVEHNIEVQTTKLINFYNG